MNLGYFCYFQDLFLSEVKETLYSDECKQKILLLLDEHSDVITSTYIQTINNLIQQARLPTLQACDDNGMYIEGLISLSLNKLYIMCVMNVLYIKPILRIHVIFEQVNIMIYSVKLIKCVSTNYCILLMSELLLCMWCWKPNVLSLMVLIQYSWKDQATELHVHKEYVFEKMLALKVHV